MLHEYVLVVPQELLTPNKKCGVVCCVTCDTCEKEYVGNTTFIHQEG